MAEEVMEVSEESGEQESITSEDTETLRGLSDEELDNAMTEPGEETEPEEAEPVAKAPEPRTPKPQQAEEPNEAAPQDERTVSREEHQRILRQLEQAKLWAARRSNEIGELRKQIRARNEQLQSNLRDVMDEDPVAGARQLRQIERNEEHIAQLEQEETASQRVIESQQLFFNYVNPEDVDVEDMCESLKRDGIDPRFIEQFKSNPFNSAHGETLVHLAKRAFAEKLVIKAVEHIKKLQAQLDAAKKKPSQVLEGVNKALKQKPTVTASGGKSAAKESIRNSDLRSMSDAELEEILRNSD